jgi:hypothetical protein
LDIEQKDKPQQSPKLESDQENFETMDEKKTHRQFRFADEDMERLFRLLSLELFF